MNSDIKFGAGKVAPLDIAKMPALSAIIVNYNAGPLLRGCVDSLLAWGVAAWVLRRAEALRLVQMPNHRSSHDHPTPNGGGLGIVVAGSLAGIALVLFSGWMVGGWLLGLAVVLAAVGLRDDVAHLPARVRFGVQVAVCVGLLVVLGDLPALALGGRLEFQVTGWILFGLLLLAGVWWINLFNFMDGIDGIAGMQAIFMLLAGAAIAMLRVHLMQNWFGHSDQAM